MIEALKGIADLDDDTKKGQKEAEERFLDSYPFHPDLTEVLTRNGRSSRAFSAHAGCFVRSRSRCATLRGGTLHPSSDRTCSSGAGAEGISEGARELTQIATVEDTG